MRQCDTPRYSDWRYHEYLDRFHNRTIKIHIPWENCKWT